MKNCMYEGECKVRATSQSSLQARLKINQANSSADFHGWLLGHLAPMRGEHVLDVGCGTGAQTLPLARAVGPDGSVSALDISADSIKELMGAIPHAVTLQAVVADMADLSSVIEKQFKVKRYDLVQSAYALYYTPDRHRVLDVMRGALRPGGRLAIFTPNAPHGLVDYMEKFHSIPEPVLECFDFGPNVLFPYFKQNFAQVDVHLFHNVVTFTDVDTVMDFYRATTYYDAASDAKIVNAIADEIGSSGKFSYEKNGYLIIGR